MADSPGEAGATRPIVVVGGGIAAGAAAVHLAETPAAGPIVLVAPGPLPGRSRDLWPALVGGEVSHRELAARPAQYFGAAQPRWLRATASGLNLAAGVVTLATRDGPVELPFRRLIWAAYPPPQPPELPGRDLAGVFHLATTADSLILADYLARERPRRGVVVGAGPLALAVAAALVRRSIHLTIFDGGEPLWPGLEPTLARTVLPELRRAGVPFYTNAPLTALEPGSRGHRRGRLRRVGSSRTSVVVDFVAIVPNPAAGGNWSAAADPASRPRLRVYQPVGSAGSDAAIVADWNLGGGPAGPSDWWLARVGQMAASAALGQPPTELPDRGIVVGRAFGIELARTAAAPGGPAGAALVHQIVEGTTRPAEGPPGRIRMILSIDPESGRLLAAQVAGRSGSAERARVLAAAIRGGLRLTDLADLDLGLVPRRLDRTRR